MHEVMRSMASGIYPTIDFDYAAYIADHLDRFARTYCSYRMAHG